MGKTQKKVNIADLVAQSLIVTHFIAQFQVAVKTKDDKSKYSVKDFYNEFVKQYRTKKGAHIQPNLYSPALILGQLYVCFLLPREDFFKSNLGSHQIRAADWGLEIKKGNDNSLYKIAKHLRNSLAHHHFEIDNDKWTFWDKGDKIEQAEVVYKMTGKGPYVFLTEWTKFIVPKLVESLS